MECHGMWIHLQKISLQTPEQHFWGKFWLQGPPADKHEEPLPPLPSLLMRAIGGSIAGCGALPGWTEYIYLKTNNLKIESEVIFIL